MLNFHNVLHSTKGSQLTVHEADYNFYVVHWIGLDIHVQHGKNKLLIEWIWNCQCSSFIHAVVALNTVRTTHAVINQFTVSQDIFYNQWGSIANHGFIYTG